MYADTRYVQAIPKWQGKISNVIALLESSVGIYVDDVSPIERAAYSFVGKKMERADFNFPFENTLFMYNYGIPSAVLVVKSEDIITFAGFSHVKDKSVWVPDECFSYFDMDSEEYIIFESIADLQLFEGVAPLKDVNARATSRISWAFFITNVLNCKNISLSPVEPPERLNRSRAKKGKGPLYRYHILTVDLDKGRKLTGVAPTKSLGTMPVHLCRGHFKEYTENKPLFGRITGRFWWQPYARGKAENGVVMKDYEVKLQ